MRSEGSRPGGSFLYAVSEPDEIFTVEDLSEEHAAIGETVDRFWSNEIEPRLPALLAHEPGVARGLMSKAAGLGLMGLFIPERFGGMDLDLASGLVVAEHTARDGSYSVWEGGHTTIGTLPLVFFGTEDQKQRYLPKLATLEMLAAYALTEPQAGSDALAIRTRADLADNGSHYILNGQKMWISNAGEADLFTVFAKVNGTDFTAFLVERRSEGLTVGAEERKMGLRGSSTAALYLDRVKVPVSNVLGQTGRGHIVAFNVLNFGRLKMGASTLGAARDVLAQSIAYARERRAFGRSIAEFGAIREKLAAMTLRIFAAESILWRTAGMIELKSGGISSEEPGAPEGKLQAIEEYAVECSIVKVFGSEMLDFVVDEGVQIHGGYGYHEDYRVERAYRDARINRIFEGTNEINRLLIPRMLLERARKGRLALLEWIEDPEDGSGTDDPVAKAKRILRLTFGLALRRYPEDLEEHQEILMRLADIVIGIYAMESVALRVRKHRVAPEREDIWQVFAQEAMTGIERAAREVIGASAPDSLRSSATRDLDAMAALPMSDMIGLRERIAARALELE